ncbi:MULTISPECIES: polyphosphate kinase 1 [Bacillota]|uniref:Polyphosphate kinase n=1 Tax=Massilimicrobiota timonensis TaxID=1776392 RepID=A0ABT7UJH6_9FIRM|nr:MULTISPECIES: polyphosphate kinase 1 [Massilimicrobiota]MDM8196304.1 polyphosphate kinase 1 [Massilimicrobiota timonensis]OUQ27692.1 polyphosphate kinase 1 [Massilimicrobiota sp. An134]
MRGCRENRELSWLKFNDRVLMQAKDKKVPLGEQLNFVSIFQSNMDEFFMVRIGTLYDQMLFYPSSKDNKTQMTGEEQLKACLTRVGFLNRKKDRIYTRIMDDLKEYGWGIVKYHQLKNKEDRKYFENYFDSEILPLISPQVVSKRQPFPFLNNKELYIIVQLESKKGKRKMGIVSCGNAIDERMLAVPSMQGQFILVEDIILHFVSKVFSKYTIKNKGFIRVTRSADIDEDDHSLEGHDDYREMMETLIKQRRKLCPIRLEISEGLEDLEIMMLMNFLNLKKNQVFLSQAPLDLGFIGTLRDHLRMLHPQLFYKKLEPRNSPMVENAVPMIKQISKKDILLAYPFESMSPFLRLLDEASRDPHVASIKMTLYRVAKNSKIVKSLIRAADNGKEVVVLVELRARFDEENNIDWSKRLEAAGCRVIYGLDGYKVHSKLCLITYKNSQGVQYVSQIGTGNYNENTAKLYTDLSLMTHHHELGEEINDVFNHLSLGETMSHTEHLMVAPHCMLSKICEYIDEQIALAKEGKEAYVGFKCNSVTSKTMINKLIEASQAGVKIDMIVRGICCIIPHVEGYTDNIRVISIVGRYLEHSRIYIFGTGEDKKVYISSADLMTRNLERRVEVATPIFDKKIQNIICSMFNTMLNDNVKACELLGDGSYKRIKNKQTAMNSQEYFFKKGIDVKES